MVGGDRMQPERQPGNAAAKRKCWSRKRIQGMDVHESVKAQKKSEERWFAELVFLFSRFHAEIP